MSRSTTVSTSKNHPQFPTKSAWARDPPQNSATSSSSQSPASPTPVSATNPTNFHATRFRRSSTLGQGVSTNDGFNIPRCAVKQDDASAPISSSPASAPAVKPADGVKSFGTVAIQNGVSDAAKSAVTNRPPPLSSASFTSSSHPAPPSAPTPSPAPKFDRKSIAKLFVGPFIQSVPIHPHQSASPASRSASLSSQHSQGQPYPPKSPSGALRQGQNGIPSAPSRSPVYSRPFANGQNGGVGVSGGRPQAGSGGTSADPTPAVMPSPRLTPHAPPGPPSGMPPPQTMWQGYYYHPQFVPGVPPDQFYQPQWPGHLIPPQHQPPPSHHPPGAGPPSAALPMSPRNPSLQLQQVPGTPTQSHALPPIHHSPHPSAPHPPPSVTSPPPMPSAANHPASLSANAGAFIPGKNISIRNPSGQGINLDAMERAPPPATPIVPVLPPSPASSKKAIKRPIRIESQEQKERRLAEEWVRVGKSEERIKTSETFAKANEDAARRQMEERELRVAEERKLKEEAEHTEKYRKEAEERAAREERGREEEQKRTTREEEEPKEADEREKEYLHLEEARTGREAEDKIQRGWTEQEKARNHRDKEEALRATEATGTLAADGVWQANIAEESPPSKTACVAPLVAIPTDLPSKFTGTEERIGTTPSSPELPRNRPGARDLQATRTNNSAPTSPSTLATARHIEDINSISYSIKHPEDEFGITAQEGNFCADTASVVPMQSLLSDPYMIPPSTPKASRAHLTGPGAKPASFLGMGSGESETPGSSRRQSAFLQHSKYFFKDGNVTFLVDGFLFCVHRYLFSHDSVYFSTRFAQLGVRDHEALSTIVSLGGVECKDFEAFLSVLYPHFEEHDLSYEQWRSVLHLSTRWGFASRRKLALESIEPPTPYDQLLLARKYAVDHWIVPALTALCERTTALTLDEARGMDIEDVVLVATAREHIIRFGLSPAEIPHRVEAMQAEALIRIAGDDVSLASSTSGPTEQPGSTANSTIGFGSAKLQWYNDRGDRTRPRQNDQE